MEPKALMSSPTSAFFFKSIMPKKGTPMEEITRMKVRQNTIIDWRPNFCMYQLAPFNPATAPTVDQNAIQSA